MSGSALDPSIPLNAGKGVAAPVSPLDLFGKFATVQNALTTNDALKANIANTQQSTEGAVQTQKLQRLGVFSNVIGGILSRYPNGIPASAIGPGLAELMTGGALRQNEVGPFIQSLPMGDDPESTAKRTDMMKQLHFQNLAIQDQIARTVGTPSLVQTGGGIQQMMVGGPRGPVPMGGEITRTLDPSQAADMVQVPVMGSDGKPTATMETVTRAEAARRGGLGTLVAPGSFGPGNGRAAPAPAPVAAPMAPSAPATGASPAVPAAPPRPTGSYGTTPPPGQVETMQASATQYAADTAGAGTFRTRILPLEEAARALKNTNTGPGTETTNNIKSFLLAQTPESLKGILPADWKDKVSNYDEAVKYLASYALNQPGAGRSDMSQLLAQTANASTHISNTAARAVVQNALALERMKQAAITHFNATHTAGQASDYGRYLLDFNNQHDPRGFVYDQLSNDEQKGVMAPMSNEQRARYLNAVRMANKYPIIGGASGNP